MCQYLLWLILMVIMLVYWMDLIWFNDVSNTFHKEELRLARSSRAPPHLAGDRPSTTRAPWQKPCSHLWHRAATVWHGAATDQADIFSHFGSWISLNHHWTIIEPSLNQMFLLEVFQSDKDVGLYQVIFLDHHSQNWPSRIHVHCRSNAVKRCHSVASEKYVENHPDTF